MRAGSHAPDGLSARDILALAHREIAVVRIRGKQIVAVFDNGQVAVTTKTAADVHHPARTSRAHHLPQLPEQQYAAARYRPRRDRTLRRPEPAHRVTREAGRSARRRRGAMAPPARRAARG